MLCPVRLIVDGRSVPAAEAIKDMVHTFQKGKPPKVRIWPPRIFRMVCLSLTWPKP